MKHLLTLTFFASAIAWGQNAPKMSARDWFYLPTPATPPAATPAGVPAAKGAVSNAASNAASGATSAAASGATKTATIAKSRPTAVRPATGNTSTVASAAGNSPAGTNNAAAGTAGAATNNPGTVVAQVGAPSIGPPGADQGHVIQASATSGPLGLRYAVLKLDPAGAYREVDPDTSFRTGDSIRLQVEANTSGYLYVVTQGTSGQWIRLFPQPDVAGGSNRVEPHVQIELPGKTGRWTFDEHAGTEKLFVVLARQPEPDLDKLIYAISGAGAGGNGGRETLLAENSIRDDVVSRLREQMNSRDLVFEKVDEGTTDTAPVKNEKAAYVVNISTAPDARVIKDFALQHR